MFNSFTAFTRFWLLISLCLTCLVLTGTAGVQALPTLRVMSWNVENLFDTLHDEGFRDEEFLPAGQRRWTSRRYWQKLNDVARVVAAVSEDGGMPGLIGLCEVENDSVMTSLVNRSLLRFFGYRYVMTHCEDARGIDVALLYQPFLFRLLEHHAVHIPSREHGFHETRDILYAKGLVQVADSVDTLHVFVVHLPSRVGGRDGDRNRKLAAQVLWDAVNELTMSAEAHARHPRIVVMGDFNASGRDRIFKRSPLRLTDDRHSPGTYCYQGLWQWLDHILVSSAVAADEMATPVRLPWLLEENVTYNTDMPFRTFRGSYYHGGISDHLPVVLTLHLSAYP